MGRLSEEINKGERNLSSVETSSPTLVEVQGELKEARQMIAEQDEENKRRDAELKASQDRITQLENMVADIIKTKGQVVVSNAVPPTAQQQADTTPPILTTSNPWTLYS